MGVFPPKPQDDSSIQLELSHLQQESEERVRAVNAELALRVAELEKANREIQNGRRAALNLMDDAVRARQSADEVNAKLRASEERLQDAMKAATMGSWRADLQTGLGTRDANLNQILGLGPIETTQPIDDGFRLTHPNDKASAVTSWRTAVETKGTYETEFRIIREDGTTRWLREQGRFIAGENGSTDLVTGVTIDITPRKLAEEALRETEERQRFLLMLSDALRHLSDPVEIQAVASRLLAEHIGVDRSHYVDFDEAGEVGTLATEYLRVDGPSLVGTHLASDFPWVRGLLNAEQPLVVEDSEQAPEKDRDNLRAISLRAFVIAPLIKTNTLRAVLVIAQSKPRVWEAKEIALVEETAQRTWAAVERARAEASLRESEARFRHVFSNNMVAMGIWTKAGGIIGANDALLDLIGYTRAELEAGIINWPTITPPEYHERDLQAVAEVEAHGSCVPYEKTYIHKSGQPIQILIGGGRFDERTAGGLFFAIDISERKQAELALRESEERFRMVADNMAQLAWTCDQLGNVTWYNRRWLDYTGMTFDEMKGWDWSKVQHPDHLDRVVARVKRSAETGEPWEDTFPLRSKTGEYRWFLSRAVPIRDVKAAIVCWFGTNTDITDQKKAETELQSAIIREQAARAEAQAANRVKDEFLATISHELRTPLNAIAGWARLLLSGKLDEKQIDRAIETIDRNAAAQATIINELLDVSRIVSGKLQIEQQPVSMVDVIHAAVEVTRPSAEAKGIEVNLKLDPGAGPVTGDSVRLQQAIWNLLSNAIKFTPKNGQIDIELTRDGTDVAIVVSDTGQGIDPAFLPHVFERFKQADSSEKRIHGGLGLGLSIVRHLIEMHGGSVRAESEGANQGSTFTLNLPIMPLKQPKTTQGFFATAAEATLPDFGEKRSAVVETPSDALSGLRVLVVDDQDDARELFSFAFKQYDAEVKVCSSAKEAFNEVSAWKPDVIVSDIGLPGENGYELIEKIRSLTMEEGGSTPALALTGYASAADAAKALKAGYQAHLAKPVGVDELAEAVAKLAGRVNL